MSLTLQYTFVAILIAGAAIYALVKILSLSRRAGKGETGGCCGCSLADNCKSRNSGCGEDTKRGKEKL